MENALNKKFSVNYDTMRALCHSFESSDDHSKVYNVTENNWPSETVVGVAVEEPGSGRAAAAVSGSSAPLPTARTPGVG